MIILVVAMANGGGCNYFNDFSTKNSDDAIIDDIINYMDHSQWNEAVGKLSQVSASGQQRRTFKVVAATAYAGRGGLDLIGLINSINANTGGSARTFFQLLMVAFAGSSISKYDDEVIAQSYMFSISTNPVSRTADENIFLVFVEFAKLGTLFAARADTDANGVVDPTFDNCSTSMITDAQAGEVIVAIGTIITSLTAAGSTVAQTALANIYSACTAATAFDPNICYTTSASSVSSIMRRVSRTLIGETNSGVGLAVTAYAGTIQLIAPFNAPPANLCP